MSIFNRLFKVGQSEAHAVIDKLEDPIKMTEQGIRDMKKDLDTSLQALAEVKALAIRSKKELAQAKNIAKDYETKAVLILQKAEKGDITPEDADRLATEALTKKEQSLEDAKRAQTELETFDKNIAQLDANVKKMRSNISHYENELKTLKARAKVSSATKKINKSLSGVDSSSTISMLEKMKDKVNQDEALAEAYGDIAGESKTVDDEIDAVLSDTNQIKASASLEELKAKLKK